MHHFLYSTELFALEAFFSIIHQFFFKILDFFCVFPSVSHLVDNYAKIVDERGRNLMCDCTLPSRLVAIIYTKIYAAKFFRSDPNALKIFSDQTSVLIRQDPDHCSN